MVFLLNKKELNYNPSLKEEKENAVFEILSWRKINYLLKYILNYNIYVCVLPPLKTNKANQVFDMVELKLLAWLIYPIITNDSEI